MKSGWVTKKLGEVCEVQLGKMLDKAKNKGKPYKYLANLSVRWHSFDLSNLRTMPFMDSEVEKFSLRPGDILMCEGGEPGRCAIWQIPDSDIKFQKAVHRDKAFAERKTLRNTHPHSTSCRAEADCGEDRRGV